ncbi:MAG: polyprenyl diphosphate synthase [Candidatus Enterosoma sp.]|nr:polyprenyl diphosphate synthase [bacterium]MDY3907578.1 polyprenyl diphosphate synthase [Candidatus Enterosoma sp.]MDY5865767.1 polyprenyl diphosphate synthase [Candidatus Enterosoma sp.]
MKSEKLKPIKHIAFIMDGNGRWAKKRFLSRSMGHKAGVSRIKEIIMSCYDDYGIYCASLFTFSTENWNRPQDEIDTLFELLEEFFVKEIDFFNSRGVKIQVLGNLQDERIPSKTLNVIKEAVRKTENNDKNVFNVLFNYGSRFEIIKACKEIASSVKEGIISAEDIDNTLFENHLYTKELSSIDLLIRTSGEKRLSNCLLYQVAYAEFIFTKKFWPDFNKKELYRCLLEYSKRDRRFGAIKDGK